MYVRNCPICNDEILYKREQSYNDAIKKNTHCISCAKSGNKKSIKKDPSLWVRECGECHKNRKYKSWQAWYNSNNTKLCNSCAQKKVGGRPHTEEHKEYMRKKMTGRNVTWGDKISEAHWSRNDELRKKIIENHSTHMSKLISTGKLVPSKNRNFKYGNYIKSNGDIEYYRSSYELKRMVELEADKNVVRWTTKHGICISYMFDGIKKKYIPDFKIEYTDGSVIIEEVKGYINDVRQFNEKTKAAEEWVKDKGYKYTLNFMKK